MDHRAFDDVVRAFATRSLTRKSALGVGVKAALGLIAFGQARTARAQGTLPLGSSCFSDSECSQVGGPVYCDDNVITSDGSFNCCRYAGGGCGTSSHCCGSSLCENGACASTSGGGGLGLGATCSFDADCSQSGGATYCDSNGISADGSLNCCRFSGGSCSSDSQCCGGTFCGGGVCGGSTIVYQPLGASCSSSAECDQSGGATYCDSNLISSDGATNCCRYAGGACSISSDCCGQNFCTNGVCG